jgi:hypothetical protein
MSRRGCSAMSCRRASASPFVVENQAGAGGMIGTLEAAKSALDGHTLLMTSNTQTANESLLPPSERKYDRLALVAADAIFRARHQGIDGRNPRSEVLGQLALLMR